MMLPVKPKCIIQRNTYFLTGKQKILEFSGREARCCRMMCQNKGDEAVEAEEKGKVSNPLSKPNNIFPGVKML